MIKAIRQGLCLLLLGLTFAVAPTAHSTGPAAQEQTAHQNPVAATLISENTSIQPGHPFWAAIHLKLDPHWHAYWKNPGDAGMAPRVSWKLPEGFHAGEIQWAAPTRFLLDQTVGFGYEDDVVLLVQITPPAAYKEATAHLSADIRWVVCSNSTCLPGTSPVALELPVNAAAPQKAEAQAALFHEARAKLPKKHEKMAAKHDDALIELSFHHAAKSTIKDAQFFPEDPDAINYTAPALFEQSADTPGKYSLVFEEMSPQESLKGVLVLKTDAGTEAYDVNVPVTSAGRHDPIASVALRDHHNTSTAALAGNNTYSFEGGVAVALVLAFVGGLILNMMPCVLPVISFKILGFINLAGKRRRLILNHGLAFSGGVLISFWVLAALLLALQAYGRSVGWGFQLQEPLFVAALAAFIFVFGLSLFGLFEIGTSIMSKAGEVQHSTAKSSAYLGSFMSGILATAVATPCTGPFLGSTVGFAVTLPPAEAMMIFTSLGLGMSFPYLALAAFPSMLRILPKPGDWMIVFKELMGFLMMASVIWLVWVFGAQTGAFATSIFLGGLFLLAIACWIYGRWASPMRSKFTRYVASVSALLFLALGTYTIVESTSRWAQAMSGSTTPSQVAGEEIADVWEEFSPQRVAKLREQGVPVFIDFTAKWCLICQANHAVLSGSGVADKFVEKGVVRMKADWTKSDEVIAAELKKFGRNSVPLYVIYHEGATEGEILPQLLTPEIVHEALDKIEVKM